MNRKERRAAALKAANDIVAGAKAAGRDTLTDDERAAVQAKLAEVDQLDAELEQEQKDGALLAKLGTLGAPGEFRAGEEPSAPEAKSLGEHFVKGLRDGELTHLKNTTGYTIATPDFGEKAETDTHGTPSVWEQTILQQVDTNLVRGFRRPLVSDLLGSGRIQGTSIKYFVEGVLEGDFTTVAPGGQKPQIHLGDPTPRTDDVKKIAAWFDMNDEMVEDVPFWVSEINNRGLERLAQVEEMQLMRGDGTGSNILGLLNRSGVQTQTFTAGSTVADQIFRAMTKVQTATGLSADGLIIHPTDYQNLRLQKDANGQYFGGGFFAGQYGSGGVEWQPPVWGLRTVVSAAADLGTPLVGAFKAAATVYRKGGVRVESTNSDLGKFTQNKITTRIEERVGLAVRIPAAIVKVATA